MSKLSFSVIGMSVHTFAAELWVRQSSCDVTDVHEFLVGDDFSLLQITNILTKSRADAQC